MNHQKIENKHNRRIARKNLSVEKRLEINKVAKEEMKKLRKEGRLKPFEKRGYYNSWEVHDYENYLSLQMKMPNILLPCVQILLQQ